MSEEVLNLNPVIPLRDVVVFPKMILPLFVGRDSSVKAVKFVEKSNTTLVLVSQKNSEISEVQVKDLYKVGVTCRIIQTIVLQDGTLKLLVEALDKVKISKLAFRGGFFQGVTEIIEEKNVNDFETEAFVKTIAAQFREYAGFNSKTNQEVLSAIEGIKDAKNFINIVAANLSASIDKKQKLLELNNIKHKLKMLSEMVEYEIGLSKTEQRIRDDVKKQVETNQREYLLNEQLKAIHKELGAKGDKNDTAALEEKIHNTKLSKDAKEKAMAELRKLKSSHSMTAESSIIRNYIEYLISLPWAKYSKVKNDLANAEKILNIHHYGLEKVK